MKTLHLTNYWHSRSGGVATFYRALMEAAQRRAHRIRLIVPSETAGIEEVNGFARIYHIKAERAPLNGHYRMLRPWQYLAPGSGIREILRAENADLVEVCDKYTLIYLAGLLRRGWLKGVRRPVVMGLSCERLDVNVAAYASRSALARTLAGVYMKWLYFPMFDHHVAVSGTVAGELLPASRGHAVRRAVWIRPMGVDADLFHPDRRCAGIRARLRRLAADGEETPLLLYAGRLVPEKNLDLLTGMLRELSRKGVDFRMLVAGEGVLEECLRDEWGTLFPGKAVYLGHVGDREELAGIFANVDVFLHPNPNEPYGIAPLEAMASGAALVAPNRGGVTTYANGGNAWLVEPLPEAFAGAVLSILDNPQEKEKRTAAARRTAELNAWPSAADRYLDLYEEIWAAQTTPDYQPESPPAFQSTLGNWLGREVSE